MVDFDSVPFCLPPLLSDQDLSEGRAVAPSDIPSNTQGIERLVGVVKKATKRIRKRENLDHTTQAMVDANQEFPLNMNLYDLEAVEARIELFL